MDRRQKQWIDQHSIVGSESHEFDMFGMFSSSASIPASDVSIIPGQGSKVRAAARAKCLVWVVAIGLQGVFVSFLFGIHLLLFF